MFTNSDDALTIVRIVDYWSAELEPADADARERRARDLKQRLIAAWWRGDLTAATEWPSRLSVLRALLRFSDEIAFTKPDAAEPPLMCGSSLTPRFCVPMPAGEPDTWSDADCREGFDALGKHWQLLDAFGPSPATKAFGIFRFTILPLKFSRASFLRWCDAQGHERPNFWRNTDGEETASPFAKSPDLLRIINQICVEMGRDSGPRGRWTHKQIGNRAREIARSLDIESPLGSNEEKAICLVVAGRSRSRRRK